MSAKGGFERRFLNVERIIKGAATLENAGDKATTPKVAFICVHNSCRSQIAEAFGRKLGAGVFEAFSAGTALKGRINPDAVRLMRKRGFELETAQRPKTFDAIPTPDVVVTMGCGVVCPFFPGASVEDWGLEDPTGRDDLFFETVIDEIERRVVDLVARLR